MMNDDRTITLLIVSDNHIVRSGLRRILDSRSLISVVGETSIRQASGVAESLKPHPEVVLVDLATDGSDALGLISLLKKSLKNSVILVAGDLGDEGRTRRALELGAAGVVLKLQPPSVLIAAIESLFSSPYEQMELPDVEPHGRMSFRPYRGTRSDSGREKITSLTERERDIVALLAGGLKNKDIAEQLHISDITVRHHLTNIFAKLGVSNRQKLLLFAHRYGLAKLALHP
jgi:DNA-binding NarL/FixJ family response regulator